MSSSQIPYFRAHTLKTEISHELLDLARRNSIQQAPLRLINGHSPPEDSPETRIPNKNTQAAIHRARESGDAAPRRNHFHATKRKPEAATSWQKSPRFLVGIPQG